MNGTNKTTLNPVRNGRAFLLPCIDTVQGFYFALLQYSPIQSVYSAFCSVNANYTAHAIKQHAELYRRFSRNLYRSAAADTRPTQAAIIPSATRWSVSQRPNALQRIPDTTATPGGCTGQHRPPYYNKVYKAQRCPPVIDLCQTVQHTTDHASPAGSRYFPRLALAWHRVSLALCFLPGTAARNY